MLTSFLSRIYDLWLAHQMCIFFKLFVVVLKGIEVRD